MNKLFAFLLLLFVHNTLIAQILYNMDRREYGSLMINDDNTCTLSPFLIEREGAIPDIALHPDGRLFTMKDHYLAEIDVKNKDFILIDTFRAKLDRTGETSLEFDKNGLLYYAGRFVVGSYNLETKENKRMVDAAFIAQGDIAFYEGRMLIAQSDKSILEFDKTTLAFVDTFAVFPNIVSPISGFAIVNNELIGTFSMNSPTTFKDTSFIFKINQEKQIELICKIPEPRRTGGNKIWGLTSEESFRTNYEMYVDLDADNSGGRFINHYELDTFCTRRVPIADRDVKITANFPIDSIKIAVLTEGLVANEKFIFQAIPNTIEVSSISPTKFVLAPKANATLADLEIAIQQIQYDVGSNEAVKLEREIAVTMYGNQQVSDIAKAFLTIDLNRVPYAGMDFDTLICPNRGFPTLPLLGENADKNGRWAPAFNGNDPNTYIALTNPPGVYQYIAKTGECPADTAVMTVNFQEVDSLGWTLRDGLIFLCSENDTVWVDISIAGEATYIWDTKEGPPIYPIVEHTGNYTTFEIIDANGCVQSGGYIGVYEEDFIAVKTGKILQFCAGDAYEHNGFLYSQDTLLCDTFPRDISGCDSIDCIQLIFDQSSVGIIDTVLAQGEVLEIGGFTLDEPKTYFINLEKEEGCDSLIQVTIDYITSIEEKARQSFSAKLFPIPNFSDNIKIKLNSPERASYNFTLFDARGRFIQSLMNQTIIGEQTLNWEVVVPLGIYWIAVTNNKKDTFYLKGVSLKK